MPGKLIILMKSLFYLRQLVLQKCSAKQAISLVEHPERALCTNYKWCFFAGYLLVHRTHRLMDCLLLTVPWTDLLDKCHKSPGYFPDSEQGGDSLSRSTAFENVDWR